MNQPRTAQLNGLIERIDVALDPKTADIAKRHALSECRAVLSNPIYAAAPAMLEALKELYRLRGLNCDLQDEASLRARAAIALATEDSK